MEKIINKIKERLEQLNIKQIIQIIKVFGVFLLDTLIIVFKIIVIIPMSIGYIWADILLETFFSQK